MRDRLSVILGADSRTIVIVGDGVLGRALETSRLLSSAAVSVVAAFRCNDASEALALRERLRATVARHAVTAGVIATPPSAAQSACEVLCASGVRVIVNFADTHVASRPGVPVHTVRPAARLLLAVAVGARRNGTPASRGGH